MSKFAWTEDDCGPGGVTYTPPQTRHARYLAELQAEIDRVDRFLRAAEGHADTATEREATMNAPTKFDELEVGYDIPALPGMDEADIQTPCLVLDLDALERNISKMGDYAKAHGMRHRVHGKMHKSVDVAKLQESLGGACGVCCQKVSEAEVFRGKRVGVIITGGNVDLDRLPWIKA